MKIKKLKLSLLIALFVVNLGGQVAYCQTRVVEDNLVYDDPTVAKEGKWIYGLSADYYRATAKTAQSGNQTNTHNLSFPGGSFFFGYGDFTLIGSYREGNNNNTINAYGVNGETENGKIKQYELMLRYLITDLSTTHFTPYLLAGFNRVEENSNQSASSGWTFSNGKTTASFSTKTNMPMLGVGGIIPVTTDYGFRADIKVGSGSTSGTSNAYNPVLSQSATKVGYQGTGTFYYNLTSNVNLQLGAQWDRVSLVPWSNATNLYGVYTKLGYTWH